MILMYYYRLMVIKLIEYDYETYFQLQYLNTGVHSILYFLLNTYIHVLAF